MRGMCSRAVPVAPRGGCDSKAGRGSVSGAVETTEGSSCLALVGCVADRGGSADGGVADALSVLGLDQCSMHAERRSRLSIVVGPTTSTRLHHRRLEVACNPHSHVHLTPSPSVHPSSTGHCGRLSQCTTPPNPVSCDRLATPSPASQLLHSGAQAATMSNAAERNQSRILFVKNLAYDIEGEQTTAQLFQLAAA